VSKGAKGGLLPGSGGGDKTGKAGTKSGGGEGKRGTSMLPKDMAAAQRKHGRGGVYGPVPLDVGPPCCQICPGKVYHEMAMLELDAHVERAALGRFHAFVEEFEAARRHRRHREKQQAATGRTTTTTTDVRKRRHGGRNTATASTASATTTANAADAADAATATALLHQHQRQKRGRSLTGLIPVPDYLWNGNPLSRGPFANVLTTTGTLDVLHQMETKAAQQVPEHTLKGGQTTRPSRPAPKGAANRKAGPCCDICAVEFIPEERADQKEQLANSLAPVQQQDKRDLQPVLLVETGERATGQAAGRDGGEARLSAADTVRAGQGASVLRQNMGHARRASATAEDAGSPANPIQGDQECCNVCGDELSPERDITDVRVSEVAFLEIKAIVTSELAERGSSPYRPFEYDARAEQPYSAAAAPRPPASTWQRERGSSAGGTRGVFQVPAFMEQASSQDAREMAPGQCCTMCPTVPNGGWLGSEPFQDPRSEEQVLNDQINDPDLMRTTAFRRTYYNQLTQDPMRAMGIKKVTQAMMKASNIIAQSNLPGGAGLAT
jgi:hypothetical protein